MDRQFNSIWKLRRSDVACAGAPVFCLFSGRFHKIFFALKLLKTIVKIWKNIWYSAKGKTGVAAH
jgi:hypothetical protein